MKNNDTGITLKNIPVLRFLVAIIIGVISQHYFHLSITPILITAVFSLVIIVGVQFFPLIKQFYLTEVRGACFIILFIAIGGMLSFTKNGENSKQWMGNYYQLGMPVLVTLQEPLVEREKTYKSLARVEAVLINKQWQPVEGNVLLYFKRDSRPDSLEYGTQLVIMNSFLPIENAGNPGGFDYREYCAFQQIYYQNFLKRDDYVVMPTKNKQLLKSAIIYVKQTVLSILRKNITDKTQCSVAEALLIGYRDDLDKDLLQAYNNTGVVHIIIISGLRMGMIYAMMLFLLAPFKHRKWMVIVKPLSILLVLWGFCLVAGAAPSVTRSAVMFTFILLGESFGKRTNIYNNLALSALIIVLNNPFSLWDAGFQLSYAAVISILLFAKHINKWFYFQNKLLYYFWSLCSVTIAAQILTLPLILFHFHQLPVLFLFTNVLAVPFSGFILYAELLLVLISPIKLLAIGMGKLVGALLHWMNTFITNINNLPFSVWEGLSVSLLQVIFLYGCFIALSVWILYKKKGWLFTGLVFLVLCTIVRFVDIIDKLNQQKLIVYNVSQHSAIDIIDGEDNQFMGDPQLAEETVLANFHLQPSRILNRVKVVATLDGLFVNENIIQSKNKIILIIHKQINSKAISVNKIKVDVIILANNPKVTLKALQTAFSCNSFVCDAASPNYKIKVWKKEAKELGVQFYSVASKGAFMMDL